MTGYHDKLCEISSNIVEHGWGNFTCEITSLKDDTVKIQINCGKSFVFFIKKTITLQNKNIL